MSIDPKLFVAKFPIIVGALGLLIVGKTLLVTGVGRCFGLSTVISYTKQHGVQVVDHF
jgi:Kef-type K+ transport system membrane component KefB